MCDNCGLKIRRRDLRTFSANYIGPKKCLGLCPNHDCTPHHEQDDEDHLIADDLGHPGSLPLHRRDPLLQARVHHLRVHLSNQHHDRDNDDDCDDQ